MEWKVHVNLEKTKVMVCSAMTPKNLLWIFPYNSIVEITDRYKYFGVILQPNSSLKHVCDYLAARASKAYFALKRKSAISSPDAGTGITVGDVEVNIQRSTVPTTPTSSTI